MNGGNIYNSGTLTMSYGSWAQNGSAENGGGIYNAGTFTSTDPGSFTFSGGVTNNSATVAGGGVFNAKNAVFTFSGNSILENTAGGEDNNVTYYAETTMNISGAAVEYMLMIADGTETEVTPEPTVDLTDSIPITIETTTSNGFGGDRRLFEIGSVFSGASLWFVIGGGVVIIAAVAAVIVIKKRKTKKPEQNSSEE